MTEAISLFFAFSASPLRSLREKTLEQSLATTRLPTQPLSF